jgi:gamma-glutamylcyclotransferase (GGCT)/AIG2-like uncharacterized protein YtfP
MILWLPILSLALVACSGSVDHDPPGPPSAETVSAEFLPRPFTSEQIRDAWGDGFTIHLRQSTPERVERFRWTVVAADEEGVEIEYATIDESGAVQFEPRIERSSWDELRDHATFPRQTTTRERVERETPLGSLEGWLYVSQDARAGTVTEMFFTERLPGAPIFARTTQDGRIVAEMVQLKRNDL